MEARELEIAFFPVSIAVVKKSRQSDDRDESIESF